jgi:hypothetical protein
MKSSKRRKLEAKGGRLISTEEFLGVSKDEIAIFEMKLAAADALKPLREKSQIEEREFAVRMNQA